MPGINNSLSNRWFAIPHISFSYQFSGHCLENSSALKVLARKPLLSKKLNPLQFVDVRLFDLFEDFIASKFQYPFKFGHDVKLKLYQLYLIDLHN
jgi:hypothetical protein